MNTTIISAPAIEPVTLSEQKAHMRISVPDEDSLIQSLIVASRIIIEKFTGVRMITQIIKGVLDTFPSDDTIILPLAPVISVDEIKTIDTNGAEAVFPSTKYEVDLVSIPNRIKLKNGESWKEPSIYREVNGVEIIFTCGYGSVASNVPEDLKLAIKLLASHFYENREATVFTAIKRVEELPLGVRYLISPYRLWQRIL